MVKFVPKLVDDVLEAESVKMITNVILVFFRKVLARRNFLGNKSGVKICLACLDCKGQNDDKTRRQQHSTQCLVDIFVETKEINPFDAYLWRIERSIILNLIM